jgi:hypothetical protein
MSSNKAKTLVPKAAVPVAVKDLKATMLSKSLELSPNARTPRISDELEDEPIGL